MADPLRQLPTLEQVAKRVAMTHQDQVLFKAILETHKDQIELLSRERNDLLNQVAELNLQMMFVMSFFRFTKEAPLVGLDGKREQIVESLGQRYEVAREKMIARMEALNDGEGVDQQEPHAEVAGAPAASDTDAETIVGLIHGDPPNGLTH